MSVGAYLDERSLLLGDGVARSWSVDDDTASTDVAASAAIQEEAEDPYIREMTLLFEEYEGPSMFEQLSPELIAHICSFLRARQIVRLSSTSKFMREMCTSDMVWKRFCRVTPRDHGRRLYRRVVELSYTSRIDHTVAEYAQMDLRAPTAVSCGICAYYCWFAQCCDATTAYRAIECLDCADPAEDLTCRALRPCYLLQYFEIIGAPIRCLLVTPIVCLWFCQSEHDLPLDYCEMQLLRACGACFVWIAVTLLAVYTVLDLLIFQYASIEPEFLALVVFLNGFVVLVVGAMVVCIVRRCNLSSRLAHSEEEHREVCSQLPYHVRVV